MTTTVLSNGVPVASGITYKPFGEMTALTYGNGIQRTVSYDQQYRMASITDAGIQNLTYSYDPNGNITAIADQLDPAKSKAYGYDPLDRLTGAQGPWGSLAYTYDGVGNRLKETSGEETLYSYQANRLISTTGQKPYAFAYDANGNTTAENVKGYIYNQNQRLIKVTEQSGEQTLTSGEYVYNGNGQRVKKTVAGQSTLFFYDQQGKLVAETGTNAADYLFLNGRPIAKAESSSIYYYHTDHLGTPQRMTDAGKIVVWAGEFKPFGETVGITGIIVNNLRFPGQYFDAETGLNYNYFRDYNPWVGRYMEADPIGLKAGMNLFIYVQNNSIKYFDKTGLLLGGDNAEIRMPSPPPIKCTGGCHPPAKPSCLKCDTYALAKCIFDMDPNTHMSLSQCAFSLGQAILSRGNASVDLNACSDFAGNIAVGVPDCINRHCKEGPKDKCGNCL